jgi:hypothetical protein
MPQLPYQRTLCDSLQNHKHIWIKKSRGLGVTEFLLGILLTVVPMESLLLTPEFVLSQVQESI